MKNPTRVLIALVVVLIVALWWSGALGPLTNPQLIQARVEAAGAWGPALFIALAMALFAVFMLAPAVWAATVIWPLPIAFAYSFIASLLASVITYFLTRQLGADWAQRRMPPRMRRWEDRLREHPFVTIITLRLLLWANPLVDMLAAVTGISARSYLLATVVGLILPTAFQISLGAGGVAAAGRLPAWAWVLVVTVAIALWVASRNLRRNQPVDAVLDD